VDAHTIIGSRIVESFNVLNVGIVRACAPVHIAIANSKTLIAALYHGIRPEFLQEYLNEFCYKFNRRYFGENLFDRLMIIAATYRTDFKHRKYNI